MTAKQTFRIAAIPADGVGLEVVEAGRAVLNALAAGSEGRFAFEWQDFPWGSAYYAEHGRMMDEDGLDQLKGFDAIYFGAVGWPTVPDHISLWGLRLRICQNFDQWANVRPAAQGRRHRAELGRGPRELRGRVRRAGWSQPVCARRRR